jgi:cysteine desulfurase/selenocysteine lyase
VEVNGYPLVYLDNGATTQKPQAVIDAISSYYRSTNSNVHRGNHSLSMQATEAHEEARKNVCSFINAASEREIIFTRGTTESINLVAFSFGEAFVSPGDEIIVTQMEHHSNFVPWQLMCQRKGAHLRVVPIGKDGELDLTTFKTLLSKRTKLVAVTHVSNALGTVNPLKDIIPLTHAAGAVVLVDGAQAVQHIAHDVRALDADFYAFSGHKMYAPTGIGVLYGKKNWLDKMPPYQSGGEMIDRVTLDKTTFNTLPFKFEAGTPNIEGAIGLAAAIHYLAQFNPLEIQAHEEDLLDYGLKHLGSIPGMTVYGNPRKRSSILSFAVREIQNYDMGLLLDMYGIAVRTGHHCAQPLMDALGIPGTVRASLGIYNTREDIDVLVDGIMRVKKRVGK